MQYRVERPISRDHVITFEIETESETFARAIWMIAKIKENDQSLRLFCCEEEYYLDEQA